MRAPARCASLTDSELTAHSARGAITHVAAQFSSAQLANAVAVVAATDDTRTNSEVSWAARERRIPVNVVDDPQLSTTLISTGQTGGFGASTWTKIYDSPGVPASPWPPASEPPA